MMPCLLSVVAMHWKRLGLVLVGCGLSLALAACDSADPGTFEEDVVVESYQVAGEPLAPVRLSRTAPVNEAYSFSEFAISGAEVAVARLDESGAVAERYPYQEIADSAGVYAAFAEERVQPLSTYRLEVRVPDGPSVTATTVVPDTFSVVAANAKWVVYQSPEQLALRLTPSPYPGRAQSFYIFTTRAMDARVERLTPLARELYDRGDASINDLRVNASPIINQASYDENADGTLTVRLPWLAITFYGPNETTISAIDDNLYDFVRSQDAQQGGGGFSPGSIPNVIEHVDGGTGVFGSLAAAEYTVFVQRSSGGRAAGFTRP